jgi:hypothetical protein
LQKKDDVLKKEKQKVIEVLDGCSNLIGGRVS